MIDETNTERPEMFPASYVDHLEDRLVRANLALDSLREQHSKCSAPPKKLWLAEILAECKEERALMVGLTSLAASIFFGIFLIYAGQALVMHCTPLDVIEKDAEIARKIRDRDADYARTLR